MDELFMKEAINIAKTSTYEVPVGAVIVYKNSILCSDHNRREQNKDPLAHAEMLVIKKASELLGRRRLNDCTLYVTLEPCPMCAGAMIMSNIKQCFFGASDTKQGCLESVYTLGNDKCFSHNVKSCGGMMENECKALLNEFFSGKRAKKWE